MAYYPEHTLLIGMTAVRRTRRLPPGAFGEVQVKDGQAVDAADVIIKGTVPGDYIIVDMLTALGIKNIDQIKQDMFEVQVGEFAEAGRVIVNMRRGKVIKAPADCLLVRIEGSQMVLQANPMPVEVKAWCPGTVNAVRGNNEVVIESTGTLVQCAWGNGKQAFTPYKAEPNEGIESLGEDALEPEFRAQAILMRGPIQAPAVFRIAKSQEMTAIIAPSMHVDLRELALRQTIPVILTEGFGELRMSEIVYNLLRNNEGRQAMIDASEPERWSPEHPEIVIPLASSVRPPAPEVNQPLVEGVFVRIARAPYAGMGGRIKRLVDVPRAVENGLRLSGAEVALSSGKVIFVPLANLELLGRTETGPAGEE